MATYDFAMLAERLRFYEDAAQAKADVVARYRDRYGAAEAEVFSSGIRLRYTYPSRERKKGRRGFKVWKNFRDFRRLKRFLTQAKGSPKIQFEPTDQNPSFFAEEKTIAELVRYKDASPREGRETVYWTATIINRHTYEH